MKKISTVLFAIIILCSACSIQQDENKYDFRCANWGDRLDVIKEKDDEIDPLCKSKEWNDIILGHTTFYDYDTIFSYHFDNEKFIAGLYQIKTGFTDEDKLIELYKIILEDLEKEYGSPIESELGEIDGGYIAYYSSFETKRDIIKFVMNNITDEPELTISWASLEYYNSKK